MRAVIVDAVRTRFGARGGALASWHAVDLLAYPYDALLRRTGIDAASIDIAVASCRTTIGEQAFNVARGAVLASGWPQSVAAFTIEGSAGAGISALQYATGLIASGGADVVIVSGVETPSRVVAGSSIGIGTGKPFGPRVHERFAADGGLLPPGAVAERMAKQFDFDRAALDEYATESRNRSNRAAIADLDKDFAISVPKRIDRATEADPFLGRDELVHEALDVSALKPLFEPGGLVTAGNMAQPVDGSSAVLIASEAFVKKHNCVPLALVANVVTHGTDARTGDTGVEVAQRVTANLPDSVFLHEDFASTPLAFARNVNANGGALGFGDAGGAAAIALITEAAHHVKSTGQSSLVVVAGTSDTAGAALLTP